MILRHCISIFLAFKMYMIHKEANTQSIAGHRKICILMLQRTWHCVIIWYTNYHLCSNVHFCSCVLAHHHMMWPLSITDGIGRRLLVTRQPEKVCVFSLKKKYKNYKQPVPQKGGHTKQTVPQNFFEGAGNILCWQLWKQQAGHTYQCKSLKFFCQ